MRNVFRVWIILFFLGSLPAGVAWGLLDLASGDAALETAVPLGSYRQISSFSAGLRGRGTFTTPLIPLLDPYAQTGLHIHAAKEEGRLLDWSLSLGARWLIPLGAEEDTWALEISGGYGMILHAAGGEWNRYITENKVYADQIVDAEVVLLRDFSWGPFFLGMNAAVIPQQSAPGFRLGLTGGYRFTLAREESK